MRFLLGARAVGDNLPALRYYLQSPTIPHSVTRRRSLRKSVAVHPDQDSIWLTTLNDAERRNVRQVSQAALLPSPDLLVLGGGIVGLATAYFAAERGLRVQVVSESTELARDAEWSLGGIIPNVCRWQFSPATQQLGQASRDWWAKLAVRPEFQIDWRVCGALMVDEQRLAPDPRQHMLAALDEGYSVHDVDAEQVALLEPALSPRRLGGLHYPSEALLHPLKAASGFITGLTRRGGQIAAVDSISSVKVESGRVTSVETSSGTIRAKTIFCDDPQFLARLAGDQLVLPEFEQTRQSFLATAATTPLLKRQVLDTHWVVQLKSGEMVIAFPSTDNESKVTERAVEQTRQLIPALRDVPFNRAWTGMSQRSANGIPVIDQVAQCENVWYSGGLDFAQLLFAPIIGKSLVDWTKDNQQPEDLVPFSARMVT
ncbi:MAG: glycine oxidase [Planctomycetaceae bacterium]|nr:glycine oxidase [Planctomycetaceae bacterium]